MIIPGSRLNADLLNQVSGYHNSQFREQRPKKIPRQSAVTMPVICTMRDLPEYSPVLIVPFTDPPDGVFGEAHTFVHARDFNQLAHEQSETIRPLLGIIQESAAHHRVIEAVIYGVTRCRAQGSVWTTYGWLPGLPPGEIHSCPGGYLRRMFWSGRVSDDWFFLNPGEVSVFVGRRTGDNLIRCGRQEFDRVLFCGTGGPWIPQHQLVVTSDIDRTESDVLISGFIRL